jgi:kynurenine formamidase
MPDHDQAYGALPYPTFTPALRSLAGTGRVFSLQQVMRPEMPQWAVQAAYRLTPMLRHETSGEALRFPATCSFERIEHSGHSGTHIDALCHVGCMVDGQPMLHGGIPAQPLETAEGFLSRGAEEFPPIMLRGLLLDVAASLNVACLPDLYEITAADLRRCEERQQQSIQPGTAVLLRTGFERFWKEPDRYISAGPGPGLEAARYLAEHGAVLTGSDTANYEVVAFPDLPAHVFLLYERGIPIVENLRLAELAAAGCTEFLFMALPIAFGGATGASVHPIAIG